MIGWLPASWPAKPWVRAGTTLRNGGASAGAFASLNLADHVGDDPDAVRRNRAHLRSALALPAEPCWLRQVHGTRILPADSPGPREADGVVANEPGRVCAILTADCLPVLFCDISGTRVAAAHAGWRGLAAGVLEQTVTALDCPPELLLVWLGPAIGAQVYEVGEEVRASFMRADPGSASAFRPSRKGHYLADLYAIARARLRAGGVDKIYGGQQCTFSEPARFFSYRRDGECGRMASLVWLDRS
ncbi:MAG: peptidoglycan editing factor PgeF [Acidiferrobacteraceae bacterium]